MKRHSIKSIVAATTLGALVAASPVAAQDAMSLSDLLRRVESGRVADNKENQNREADIQGLQGRSGSIAARG